MSVEHASTGTLESEAVVLRDGGGCSVSVEHANTGTLGSEAMVLRDLKWLGQRWGAALAMHAMRTQRGTHSHKSMCLLC